MLCVKGRARQGRKNGWAGNGRGANEWAREVEGELGRRVNGVLRHNLCLRTHHFTSKFDIFQGNNPQTSL